ncbi:hypothetical protein ASG31_10255 [Chryseobacterium sp. Leaf404]|uniref:hypothetical protein n=1 Tax=unclassified Chryseobacterium TaxID=2593645 RepID=UPI00070187DD|nr:MULTISPECIES: hypothetical protein [unclassified Chryseobacterium]KQT16755.1 hypothetical protein ASG31_10255 [Chryseobacterium sp. Leaf404]
MKKLLYLCRVSLPPNHTINVDFYGQYVDVAGNGASTTVKDGIIAPRLSKQQLAAKSAATYAAAQTGSLIYVNDITAPAGTIQVLPN